MAFFSRACLMYILHSSRQLGSACHLSLRVKPTVVVRLQSLPIFLKRLPLPPPNNYRSSQSVSGPCGGEITVED